MRIAQIAPLAESCPPQLYGGTERIVSYLTEALVAAGHEVTLFASADSTTKAELVPGAPAALRLNPDVQDVLPHHIVMLDKVMRRAHEFDVLHFHTDYIHFPLIRSIADRTVTTLHGRLDLPDLESLLMSFTGLPLVSISNSQRSPVKQAMNWVGTVQHGLPFDLLPFSSQANGGYLAFLGRISPEKGPEAAIEIARRTGLPLKMAAKIDTADRHYWNYRVEPLVKAHPNVEFVGEIGEKEKAGFLGNALALLFPIDWPEPFGLVMIEALACGTPVIAFPRGAVPEVIEEGTSGFIVRGVDEAVGAIGRIGSVSRRQVRAAFERRFTARHMAENYLSIYRRQVGERFDTARIRRAHGELPKLRAITS